jgi:hypothetical protein
LFRFLLILFFCVFIAGFATCQKEVLPAEQNNPAKPMFDSLPAAAALNPIINEASGIADSKKNTGFLWAQEDGGNPTQLYLLKHDGTVQKKIYIKGAVNRDWEDMALAGNDIYIGEIGDNNAVYPGYAFYKFGEPDLSVDTISNFETILFRYPDGSHDAEAFLVELATNTIYIITKRDNPSRIYKLTPPFSPSTVATAEAVGQLSYSGVVGAAISPDGKEVIVKTYLSLHHYKIASGEKIETALQKAPTIIPYVVEPQGEAVCFSTTNNGYFTLSEKGFAPSVRLYFYKRN